jgi:hypothetical protein
MEEKKKSPITLIAFMALLLILALTGGYLLGNDDFLKLRTEEPSELTKEDDSLKKIDESKVVVPAKDLYTYEYLPSDGSFAKGHFVMFMVVDGDLYYEGMNDPENIGIIRSVDFLDVSDKKDLKKVDVGDVGKIKRIKGWVFDDRLFTMIIAESGKVYTIRYDENTGAPIKPELVNELKEYEVDDIISYKRDETNVNFEIVLNNGETVKK